jgi:uncharacterized SAM-binding protein YcdF (DUF218 family)
MPRAKNRSRWTPFSHRSKRRGRSAVRSYPVWAAIASLCLVFCGWMLINFVALRSAAVGEVDAYLVLGGSIQREIYVAELAKQHPETPVLISTGSEDPCIWLIFERANAPIDQVWIEDCAQSTFGNFYFAAPILKEWNAHKVRMITSGSHLPRAMWLAQILLGAHGIWVEPEIVPEQGVPGNQESRLKTGLDVGRSLVWAIAGQFYQPRCFGVRSLSSVDINRWRQEGFRCEHQGNLEAS